MASDDGNVDDDERRDGEDGEVSLLQMEVKFNDRDQGVGGRAQRWSKADMQGPMVAMQPQVAEVY